MQMEKVVGSFSENPMLNTLVYECEFPDGTPKEYAANIIAETSYLSRTLMVTERQ